MALRQKEEEFAAIKQRSLELTVALEQARQAASGMLTSTRSRSTPPTCTLGTEAKHRHAVCTIDADVVHLS